MKFCKAYIYAFYTFPSLFLFFFREIRECEILESVGTIIYGYRVT